VPEGSPDLADRERAGAAVRDEVVTARAAAVRTQDASSNPQRGENTEIAYRTRSIGEGCAGLP
jgi:hypothetical protein